MRMSQTMMMRRDTNSKRINWRWKRKIRLSIKSEFNQFMWINNKQMYEECIYGIHNYTMHNAYRHTSDIASKQINDRKPVSIELVHEFRWNCMCHSWLHFNYIRMTFGHIQIYIFRWCTQHIQHIQINDRIIIEYTANASHSIISANISNAMRYTVLVVLSSFVNCIRFDIENV